jgi:hypothetical protein
MSFCPSFSPNRGYAIVFGFRISDLALRAYRNTEHNSLRENSTTAVQVSAAP